MDLEEEQQQQPRSSKYVFICVLTVNLLSLSGGISIGWTSPILPKLTDPNRTDENPIGHVITKNEESWIVSLLMLSPTITAYPWSILADRIGRKWTLTVIGIPMLASYIILAVARSVILYIIARLLFGLAMSGMLLLSFVYVGEISDVKNRGKLLSLYTNFFSFGILFAYVLGAYLSIMVFNFIAAMILAVFLSYFSFVGVESPVYLLKKNRRREAQQALRKLRTGREISVERELKMIENEIRTSEEGTFRDVITDRVLTKSLTISVALVVFQQFSGINVVLSYTESIFEDAGSSLSSEVSAIIVGTVQLLASSLTPIFVDRAGRKVLLILSAVGMIITEASLGAYFYIRDNTDINTADISWLPILLLIIFIIVYSGAFGIVPYTIMGEIFPSKVRSVATATVVIMNGGAAFLTVVLFRTMQGSLGNAGTYWLFGGFCVLALIFTILFVPETKGKSLEEIHRELRGSTMVAVTS